MLIALHYYIIIHYYAVALAFASFRVLQFRLRAFCIDNYYFTRRYVTLRYVTPIARIMHDSATITSPGHTIRTQQPPPPPPGRTLFIIRYRSCSRVSRVPIPTSRVCIYYNIYYTYTAAVFRPRRACDSV